jgi:hypothetical protein
MIDTSLRVRDDLVADSASYNMLMTTRLRAELGPSVWGNWTLEPAVEAGMVGVVDPVAGTFELHKYGAIPLDVDIVEDPSPGTWCYESDSVAHTEETVDFDDGYADPSSGEQVTVGLREEWRFTKSHTIASRGTRHSRRSIDDPIRAAEDHFGLILRWADHRGYATRHGIVQGFGVVTATYQALGVLNLAARTPDQSFSVDGSVAGVSTLTGRSGAVSVAAASYLRTDPGSGHDIEAHLHPGVPGRAAAGTVAYAFEFLSFSGRTCLPGWVGHIPTMSVSVHNSGSYVVQCTVAFDTPEARDLRKRVQVSGGIPGWVSLPVDATNVRVTCRFWHVDDWGPRVDLAAVARPMQEWRQGQGSVQIQGWWPGDYDVAWAA